MTPRYTFLRAAVHACTLLVLSSGLATSVTGCSKEKVLAPAPVPDASDRFPKRDAAAEAAPGAATPYRVSLGHGAELYLPTWFSSAHGTPGAPTYDLVVHYHGLGKLQEANLDRSRLDVAVVSINLGVGTEAYESACRDRQAFPRLVEHAEKEIEKSERVPGAHLGRIALSAWSAGFVCVSKILNDPSNASRVDAVLLADGFFTSFTNVKKRTVNAAAVEKFVPLATAATRDDKLFALTHTSIPTVDYASVEETVAKLLQLAALEKTPSTATGPKEMRETYTVDRGSFHVKGYDGKGASDHIKQITALGETLYPYLKARWERRTGP